jgi:hypothetical protein
MGAIPGPPGTAPSMTGPSTTGPALSGKTPLSQQPGEIRARSLSTSGNCDKQQQPHTSPRPTATARVAKRRRSMGGFLNLDGSKGIVMGAGKPEPSYTIIMRQKREVGKPRLQSKKAHGVQPVGLIGL